MPNKLTAAEKRVQDQMLALLEWATEPPSHRLRWHDIGPLNESKEAAKRLEARGVVEVSHTRNQYRLTPKG